MAVANWLLQVEFLDRASGDGVEGKRRFAMQGLGPQKVAAGHTSN